MIVVEKGYVMRASSSYFSLDIVVAIKVLLGFVAVCGFGKIPKESELRSLGTSRSQFQKLPFFGILNEKYGFWRRIEQPLNHCHYHRRCNPWHSFFDFVFLFGSEKEQKRTFFYDISIDDELKNIIISSKDNSKKKKENADLLLRANPIVKPFFFRAKGGSAITGLFLFSFAFGCCRDIEFPPKIWKKK